jgi:protein involved in polysaccharide export with SLBB domain
MSAGSTSIAAQQQPARPDSALTADAPKPVKPGSKQAIRDSLAAVPRPQATRAELEALLAGKSRPVSEAEQRVIRDRLKQGDLQPGDRVLLEVAGEKELTDTFTVRPERSLLLPNLPEISLVGVLRSELQGYLEKQLGRYLRDPVVQATALVRVGIFGPVAKPGYYNLPADALAPDAIMAAGGPGGNADPSRSVIRRNTVELASKEEVARAINAGQSLDQMNIQSGDQIIVGERSGGFKGTLQTMGLVSGALFGIVYALSKL